MPSCGVDDVAWRRPDALAVIEAVRSAGLRVLGGDVLRRSHERIEFTYDSWHSQPEDLEDLESFARRSCDHACSYVTKYGQPEDDSLLFVVVVA